MDFKLFQKSLLKKIAIILPLFISVIIGFLLFNYVSWKEHANLNIDLDRLSKSITKRVQLNLVKSSEILNELSNYYSVNPDIKNKNFLEITNYYIKLNKYIKALEWIPEIQVKDREFYELKAIEEGIDNFNILALDSNGIISVAEKKSIYYPVYYVQPIKGNEKAIGFDLSSESSRHEAILTSKQNDTIIATAPINLVQDNAGVHSFLLFKPHFTGSMNGFFLGVFRFNDILNYLLDEVEDKRVGISFYDDTVNSSHILSFNFTNEKQYGNLYNRSKSFYFAGRNYLLVFSPNSEYIDDFITITPHMSLISLILIGFLLSSIILFQVAKKDTISKEVKLRTKELVKTRYELLNERNRLAAILEGTNVGTWEWNIKTGESIYDDKWAQIVGYTLEELEPVSVDTWLNICHPDDLKKSEEALNNHFKGLTEIYECESRLKHKDGSWIWVLARGKVKKWDIDGNPVLMYGTHKDITTQKHTEKSLHQTNKDLQDLAIKAEAANIAKRDFLANMSHEIRTPLNGIIGMSSLFLNEDLSENQKDYAISIKNSSYILLDLVNDILDFSKIEAGKLKLENTRFSMVDIFDEVTETISFNKNVNNIYFFSPVNLIPDYEYYGDPVRIRQIILNLVTNAIKFTHKGGVEVSFNIEKEWDLSQIVKICVKDTGIGLTKEHCTNIFNKFSQADGSTTRKYGGTGLGLAISKELVNLMGGDIGVESHEGKGSTFWFKIPIRFERTNKKIFPDFNNANIKIEVTNKRLEEYLTRILEKTNIKLVHDNYKLIITDKPELKTDTKKILIANNNDTEINDNCKIEHLPLKHRQFFNSISLLLGLKVFNVDRSSVISSIDKYKGYKVLVVEDNLINQKVAKGILSKYGLICDFAVNGVEGLKLFNKNKYDLIFMDCHMPELDGFETTKEIRKFHKDPIKRLTPIIAMTADAIEGYRLKCINSGMNDYISKPVNLNALSDILYYWLSSKIIKENMDTVYFDYKTLCNRLLNKESKAKKVIQGSHNSVTRTLSKLKFLIDDGDYDSCIIEAHKLKVISANIEAVALSYYSQQVKESIQNNMISSLEFNLNRVIHSYYMYIKESSRYC